MTVLWTPSPERISTARITAFADWLRTQRGLTFADYEAMWTWSVTDLDGFWSAVWQFFDLQASRPYRKVLADPQMPGAVWFPGARLNLADHVFRHRTSLRSAIVFRNEAGERGELGWDEMFGQVAGLATSLRGLGVKPGDRVVAYLPNVPATVVAFLAVAAIGAVWSVCSPDMGPVAVLDRFRQIEPKVLIAGDGYRYGGKAYDRSEVVAELRAALPSLTHTICVPTLDPNAAFHSALPWNDLIGARGHLETEQVPFDHPLWIVYSSGTTGMPKAIVHGHGGILVETVKWMGLHNDLGPDDRFHWYSSTGWIMWNCQVGGLLLGSTICLYDGNPGFPDFGALWRFVSEERISFFGAGAAYYANCIKAGIEPGKQVNLAALRALGSTGSPLSADAYRWVYDAVKRDVWLTAVSGGTDLAGAFVGGLPVLPVYEGEMQCRALGAKVEAWDENGAPKIDEVGELVCAAPMPSMPLYFWNDPGDARLRESYFDMFPGVWRHGDWIRLIPRPEAVGSIIYGRSDATINRYGIRMGTAELYRAVEALPEVLDSLVVDLEYLGRESYMPLFVVVRSGIELDDALRGRINGEIKRALSARHVPNEIIAITEVPRTLSGKKMELPIKKLLLGQPVDRVANPDAMANPSSLTWFAAFAQTRSRA
jgi:acetoacetyl-CoA synthetase